MKVILIFSVCLLIAALKTTKSNGKESVIHNVLDLYPEFHQLQHTIHSLHKTVGTFKRQLDEIKQTVSNINRQLIEIKQKVNTPTCSPPYLYNAELKLCWGLKTHLKNWRDARMQCVAEGGDLIILDTPAKIAFIKKYLAVTSISKNYVWVGGDNLAKESTFRWIDGETVQGIPWYSGQPNNHRSGENCLAMNINFFKFFNLSCDNVFDFLCQKT